MTMPPQVEQVLQLVERELADSHVAAYLHGSAVSGGLQPDSDVDLLIVVNRSLTHENRRHLVHELMKISGRVGDPAKRPIELTIVQMDDLASPTYPARREFLYGEWLREYFEVGTVPEPERDPEITLMLAQARQEAKTLFGPDADELLPVIPQSDVRRAIGDALPALLAALKGDERNVLLTLARMWHTLETGEFVPKDVAAEWAANHLPPEQGSILVEAGDAYAGKRKDTWGARQHELQLTVDSLRQRVTSAL
jgi:predicted nucleotidyltransferase